MSVRPTKFNADGSVEVVFDELGHSGTIPAAEVKWSKKMDQTDDHNFIVLNCPDGCGASSTWPVGGGADATMGQQMFVNKTKIDGCACGVCNPGDTSALPESHVRLNVNRLDGPGRWALG